MAEIDHSKYLEIPFDRRLIHGVEVLLQSSPLRKVVSVLADSESAGVIFGGSARDLGYLGYPPRDIDIVVEPDCLTALRSEFENFFLRETRFGGFRFLVEGWFLDIWSLDETWAFRAGIVSPPSFGTLPRTTFLNVEAIAVDLIPQANGERSLFTYGFFQALDSQLVEINLEKNPFPDLCVVRSLLTAARLDFAIGPRLKNYISKEGLCLRPKDIKEIQRVHYGEVKWNSNEVASWLAYVCDRSMQEGPIRVPISEDSVKALREKWADSGLYLRNVNRSVKA